MSIPTYAIYWTLIGGTSGSTTRITITAVNFTGPCMRVALTTGLHSLAGWWLLRGRRRARRCLVSWIPAGAAAILIAKR